MHQNERGLRIPGFIYGAFQCDSGTFEGNILYAEEGRVNSFGLSEGEISKAADQKE